MRNPYTKRFDFGKFRAEIFPLIRSGLEKCENGALEAFDDIQEKTSVLEGRLEEEMDNMHHTNIDMPLKVS